MMTSDRGVITLAYGVAKYVEMAKTLARSLCLHSPGIARAIVTDRMDDRQLAELFDIVIPLRDEYGSNVRQKLYLDHYSPFKATAFIDCDSIVVRDVQFIFDTFQGISFSVPGERYLVAGQSDPFVDVDRVLTHFNIARLPKFNGGLYYFERGDEPHRLFRTAREILANSRALRFEDFRGDGPGDEPIVAVAMMLHDQQMFRDEGRMMQTPLGIVGALDIDVLAGTCVLRKGARLVAPAILHFAGAWCEHPFYYREARRLEQSGLGQRTRRPWALLPVTRTKLGYHVALWRFYVRRALHQRGFARHVLNRLTRRQQRTRSTPDRHTGQTLEPRGHRPTAERGAT